MSLQNLILNDIQGINANSSISTLKQLFNQLTYSHLPVVKDKMYLGCISETDIHCFEGDQALENVSHAIEPFFVTPQTNWLNVLEAFAKNNSNIMPVLDEQHIYLGYYELKDFIQLFNDTPFLSEYGHILIIEKGIYDYSFSEISQIVESNNAKLLGAFISEMQKDLAQITLKISNSNINDIILTFRRYSYNIVSNHDEDIFRESLKKRSKYLNKYLNI